MEALIKYAEKYGYSLGKPDTISFCSFLVQMPNGSIKLLGGLDIIPFLYEVYGTDQWSSVAYKDFRTVSSVG